MAGRMKKPSTPKEPPDPQKLARVAAGRYATGDGRFLVEQSSGGWMITDAEQANELGLPLVRGPFATLDGARESLDGLRAGPAPISDLAERIAALPKRAQSPVPAAGKGRSDRAAAPMKPPEPEPVVIREFRSKDGDGLRALWEGAGFRSLGDDDMSLRRFAQRNPGLVLVAAQGSDVVGSAMGGWDGRRGWIYHLATAEGQRRKGLATQLVRRVEAGLRAVGCRRISAIVRGGDDDGAEFWAAMGYAANSARQFARELPEDEGSET